MASRSPPRSGGLAAAREAAEGEGFWAREAAILALNAEERRAQAPVRFMISLLIAVATATVLNIPAVRGWLWLWVGLNITVQVVEIAALWRFGPAKPLPGRGAVLLGFLMTTLVAGVFGCSTLILWSLPGMLGPAAAVLILAGSLLNVMALAGGSASALVSAAAPYALLLVLGPSLVRTDLTTDRFYPLLVMAEVLYVLAISVAWRRNERARAREEAARRLAEDRRAEAEAATQAKTRYAAAVSHELRTPLTAILAAAADSERRAQTPWGHENARLVGEAGRMMRRLLDDLLDLAKIEAGHMGVEAIAFSPRALVEEVRRFWEAEAAGAGVALVLQGAEALPARALGDPTRLRQVLNNLVSNAVKFTPKGEVRLTCRNDALPEGGARLTVEVADTGRGIAPDQVERLFTPFHQAHDPTTVTGGTGLGLAISRELARLMGGDVTAVSSVEGSRFTVSVVAAAAPADSLDEPAGQDADGAGASGIRLLVVDDQPLVRKAMGILLEPLGLVTEYAASGTEALDRLNDAPFDLVLMDVNMADLDGVETTRRLRRSAGPNRDTPVLAVTGAAQADAEASYRESGMNGLIAKPLEPRPFYAALESALRRAA